VGSPGALPGALNTDGSKTSAKSTPADGDADSIAEGPLEAIHHHTDTAVGPPSSVTSTRIYAVE